MRRGLGLAVVAAVGLAAPAFGSVVYIPNITPHMSALVRAYSNLCIRHPGDTVATGLRLIVINGSVNQPDGHPIRVVGSPREWVFVQSDGTDGEPVLATGQFVEHRVDLVWNQASGPVSLSGTVGRDIAGVMTEHRPSGDVITTVALRELWEAETVPVCGHEPPRPDAGDSPEMAPSATPAPGGR